MQELIHWNANLYDDKHQFVSDFGQGLVELLAPEKGELILDAGCGTGMLAAEIADKGATVYGIDLSASMIEKAKSAYPDIHFQVADLTGFNLGQDLQFDAVFSNATLHWVRPPEAALRCIYQHLAPGGRFVLEMGGHKNVAQITQAIKETLQQNGYNQQVADSDKGSWYFPSVAEYTTLLERQGFEVQLVHYFERPTKLSGDDGMAKWIEMFGLYLFKGIEPSKVKALIDEAVEKLRPTHFIEGNWWADYRRLRIKARKLK